MLRLKKLAVLLFTILGTLTTVAQLPKLVKSGNSTKMMVADQAFVILGAEMHNSTGTDTTAVTAVMKRAKKLNMNTVLGYAYWEMVEPKEGEFNFDLVDHLVNAAKKEDLKLILVWFGSWKSTMSSYVPEWVKTNPKRFPRYTMEDSTTLEILSPFYEENLKADTKAYVALMKHLKNTDKENTVIMLQPENEPGTFANYRDYSSEAQKAWKTDIPISVGEYLNSNKGKLYHTLETSWAKNGSKTSGKWSTVFSDLEAYPQYADELFMAFHYSKYINSLAAEGRKILDLPSYCNGWLYNKLGHYPHGTINPHVLDMYRAGGDALDFYSPNVYSLDYDTLFTDYKTGGNTLFIPESILSPAGVLYSIGNYDAIGFAPYGIDDFDLDAENTKLLASVNKNMQEMGTLLTDNFGSDKMQGLYFASMAQNKSIAIGDYVLRARSPESHRFAKDFGKSLEQAGKETISFPELMGIEIPQGAHPPVNKEQVPPPNPFAGLPKEYGAAIVIQNNKDEFYIIGYGLRIDFALKEGIKFKHLGYLSIDEGHFKNNEFIPTKRWNGDELKVELPNKKLTMLKVRLYHF